jgi:hypothetical protein
MILKWYFHPIQWVVCFNVFSYQASKKSVDYLNLFLVGCTLIFVKPTSLKASKGTTNCSFDICL